jgi:hypothetical protein
MMIWAFKGLLTNYRNGKCGVNWNVVISHEGKLPVLENIVVAKLEARRFINDVVSEFVNVAELNVRQCE